MDDLERRSHFRHQSEHPCKLYLPRVGKYVAGTATNLSTGGTRIELDQQTFFETGESIRVGLATDPAHPILNSERLLNSRVAWTWRTPGGTAVGLRFTAKVADTIPKAA